MWTNLSEVNENTKKYEEDDTQDDGECQPRISQGQQIIQVVGSQVYLGKEICIKYIIY